MPQYTEYERILRHLQKYNEYPPPPRRYRKWDLIASEASQQRLFGNDANVETNINYIIEAVSYVMEGKETYESVKRWLDALKVRIPEDAIPRIIREVQALFPNKPISQIALTVQYVCTGRVTSTPAKPITQPTQPTTTENGETPKEKEKETGFPAWGWAAIAAGAFLLLKGKL